jgi:hypothetical protein
VDWKARFPEWAKNLPEDSKKNQLPAEEYERMCAQVEAYLQNPNPRIRYTGFRFIRKGFRRIGKHDGDCVVQP